MIATNPVAFKAYRWNRADGRCTQESVSRLWPGAKLVKVVHERLTRAADLSTVSVVLACIVPAS